MERPHDTGAAAEAADDDNSLEYRNVDEEADYDERGGSQGSGAGEPPPDEERRKPE